MFSHVVVTGIGVLTSIGAGRKAFADGLRSGACGIAFDPSDGLGIAARAPFDFEECLAALGLSQTIHSRALKAGRRAPPSIQSSIISALEAWLHAFGADAHGPAHQANIIVAGNNIAPGYQHRMQARFASSPELIPASYALHFLDTDHVGTLSEVLQSRAEGFTVGGASASGNMAILQAWRQIRHGISGTCLVVGAMTDLSPLELQSFRNAGALGGKRYAGEPLLACRPFDLDREGFIYGQGSACLVLESADSAKARGAEILGHIAGAAACLDANRQSNPSVEGEARAMRLALEQAGMPPESVDYVNAHGTSSVAGDEAEVKALKEIFSSRIGEVRINATKGLTGHCLHAAGVVEAAATLLQMNLGFIHPNRNLDRAVDPVCGFAGAVAQDAEISVALSNSFGFGGINTSLIITRHEIEMDKFPANIRNARP
jgi:malonyl-ACP decarboxylase